MIINNEANFENSLKLETELVFIMSNIAFWGIFIPLHKFRNAVSASSAERNLVYIHINCEAKERQMNINEYSVVT